MADFKRHTFRHLRSARVWLTRAEESFDNDSKIRGELDLLLAQAELQHAKETTSLGHKRPFLRHAVSFALAAAIVAAGFGAYWGLSARHVTEPIPLAAQEAKVTPAPPRASDAATAVRVEDQRPVAIPKPTSNTPTETISPVQHSVSTGQTKPAAKDDLLSPDEMKTVIRAAGKSLRGQ